MTRPVGGSSQKNAASDLRGLLDTLNSPVCTSNERIYALVQLEHFVSERVLHDLPQIKKQAQEQGFHPYTFFTKLEKCCDCKQICSSRSSLELLLAILGADYSQTTNTQSSLHLLASHAIDTLMCVLVDASPDTRRLFEQAHGLRIARRVMNAHTGLSQQDEQDLTGSKCFEFLLFYLKPQAFEEQATQQLPSTAAQSLFQLPETPKPRLMLQPINVIFRHLQQQTRVSLWLYDNIEYRIEGKIIGFDEFMNVTLAEAEEVPCSAEKERKPLGMYLIVWMLTRAFAAC
ncbi:hypothetical protein MCAP1_001404 [Malassezia caprae]|uniref:Sm protein E n=1 Tax=Malassezia caprae TaxID=1381934 RepID=A0AAF0E6K6_9BASI|nr:hypothetical protein MCAP1_001404 [Malassezia caprae]